MSAPWKCALPVALLLHACLTPPARAGHPTPGRYPQHYRDANRVLLNFQDALDSQRWDDALALSSDRVRAAATNWSSTHAFFTNTIPLHQITREYRFAPSGGRNKDAFHSYSLFINLTDDDVRPMIQWKWQIFTTNGTWALDWEPTVINLEARTAETLSKIRAREALEEQARHDLEPKLRYIKTHLTAVSKRFVIGAPMLFRLELLNFGPAPVQYSVGGIGPVYPLRVLNTNREPMPFVRPRAQIVVAEHTLPSNSSNVLADALDISKSYSFHAPGTYYVQFDGLMLTIGEQLQEPELTFENMFDSDFAPGNFVASPVKFPSNILRIEIVAPDASPTNNTESTP